ncbi:S-adenosyl-L-methionine-dependent methyltransferase [Amylocystis lapponica]|nr:S-adenosyl-L-methionine-dependent methyltransferase [Amylocystis lapponica]
MNFYFDAAKVLDKLDAKQGSIKGVLATTPEKSRKRTAALVIETLKYKSVLVDAIDAAKLLKEERKITSKNLALVLVHDLLLSGGIQAGDGPVKQAVLRHKTRLHSEFQRIKIKRGAISTTELASSGDSKAALIPRYVRVNTLCWTTEQAIEMFVSRGFQLSGPFVSDKGFSKDEHMPDLLAFPPNAQLVDDPLYKAGKLIFQDKASCFPAYVLGPPAQDDSVVIDATAAPGNKTSHLCALMQNRGKLFAFERDRKRFSTLKMMLSKAHCQNVEAVNVDFLMVSPDDQKYREATHILLDPSCSGSGIVNRLDHLLETGDRLNKLAAFQLLMIRHAMKFPSVHRIVYSTCSVHATENEHVVREALKSEEASSGHFALAPPEEILPRWHRRGLGNEMDDPAHAQSLVRCSPGDDATNGFFVSLFVRASFPSVGQPHPTPQKRKGSEAHIEPTEETKHRRKRKKKAIPS